MNNRYISPNALDHFVPALNQGSDIGEVRIRIPVYPRLVRVSSIARDLGRDADYIRTLIDDLDTNGEVYHDYIEGEHRVAVVPGHWVAWDRNATAYFKRAYAGAMRRFVRDPEDGEIAVVRKEFQLRRSAKLTPRQQKTAGRMEMEGCDES